MTDSAVFHETSGDTFRDAAGPITDFPTTGGGAVSSVFGRTGAVVAVTGDYYGAVAAALTGATQASRYVGATTSGAPASGTFVKGDWVVAQDGHIFVCTTGGTPGTWIDIGGGSELDYVETTSVLTVTATSDATAQTFVSGNAISLDGSTRVLVEFFCVMGSCSVAMIANLYDGSTDLGRISQINANVLVNIPMLGKRFLTPSNASHTFSIRAWKASGTASMTAGAGGTATYLPGYIRVTRA